MQVFWTQNLRLQIFKLNLTNSINKDYNKKMSTKLNFIVQYLKQVLFYYKSIIVGLQQSSHHSSMVSMAACYQRGPKFKSRKGR